MVTIEYKKYFFDNDLNLNNGVKSNEVKEDIKNSEKSESRKEIIKSNHQIYLTKTFTVVQKNEKNRFSEQNRCEV